MNETNFHENQSVGGFRLLFLIGVGKSSEVWSAIDEKTNDIIALKIFTATDRAEKNAEYEYSMSIMFHHPNVLSSCGICQIDGHPVNIMPYCMGRSVEGIAGYISLTHVWKLLYDISSALSVIHLSGYGHFNIKPSNILWNGDMFILSDFSCCQKINDKKSGTSPSCNDDKSSYRFDAPELFDGERVVESDIWSLGATVFYLYMGCHVFNGLGGRSQKRESPLPYMRRTLPELSNLISQCLSYDCSQRPTVDDVVRIAKEQNLQCLSKKLIRSIKIHENNVTETIINSDFWPDQMIENKN
jgi:serine/threonine protein kinase